MTTEESDSPPPKKRSERTCAGCGKHAEPRDLVRVILDPSSGDLAVDLAHTGFGRGAHVHGAPSCLAKALKGGFARVFKAEVKGDAAVIGQEIVLAADRRIEGLISGAKRAGHLAIGADAVSEATEARLIVVAKDAAAAAKLPTVQRAVASGDAIAFAEKARLGALVQGNREVAVIAILHSGVAAAVQETYRLSGAFRTTQTNPSHERCGSAEGGTQGGDAWTSSEVR